MLHCKHSETAKNIYNVQKISHRSDDILHQLRSTRVYKKKLKIQMKISYKNIFIASK